MGTLRRVALAILSGALLIAMASPAAAALAKPTNVQAATVSSTSIRVTWNAPNAGETRFEVQRSLLPKKAFKKVGEVSSTGYTDSGLTPATKYYYRVRSEGAGVKRSRWSVPVSATTSPATAPDTTPPSVPGNVNASAANCTTVTISWSASTDTGGSGLNRYELYRDGEFVKSVTPPTTSTSDTIPASTTASYSVLAVDNAANASALSAPPRSATTPACPGGGSDTTPPPVPGGLQATASSCNTNSVAWHTVTDTGGSGLRGYELVRDGTVISTPSGTTAFDRGLPASTPFSYRVRAVDNAGNASALSAPVSRTTQSCTDTEPPPTLLTTFTGTVQSCTSVSLSWNPFTDVGGSGLKGYDVHRGGVFVEHVLAPLTTTTVDVPGGTTSSMSVRAVDWMGNPTAFGAGLLLTTPDCADGTAPPAPTGAVAVATSCSTANVSWVAAIDPGSGVKEYAVYRGASLVKRVAAPLTATVDIGLAPSTAYSYSVRAIDNGDNVSAASAAAVANTPACPAAAPAPATWAQRWGGTLADAAMRVATDPAGNVYAAGIFKGTASFGGATLTSAGGYDVYLAKYSPTGAHLWSKRFGAATDDLANGLAVDSNGNATITGHGSGSISFGGATFVNAGVYDGYVASFDTHGSHRWSRQLGGPGIDQGRAVAVDRAGNVFVTGNFEGVVDFGTGKVAGTYSSSDVFVAKYSATGTPLWTRPVYGPSTDHGLGVAADDAGDIVIGGVFNGMIDVGGGTFTTAGVADAFVAKLSGADGAHQWSHAYGSDRDDVVNAVNVDRSGNVVLTGYNRGAIDFGGPALSAGIFLAKLTPAGAHAWSKGLGSAATEGRAVTTDATGAVYVAGLFGGSATFGPSPVTAAGSNDGFVAKYSPTGAYVWAHALGGTGADHASGLALGNGGVVVVAGGQSGGTFAGVPLTSAGSADAYALSLSP